MAFVTVINEKTIHKKTGESFKKTLEVEVTVFGEDSEKIKDWDIIEVDGCLETYNGKLIVSAIWGGVKFETPKQPFVPAAQTSEMSFNVVRSSKAAETIAGIPFSNKSSTFVDDDIPTAAF